MTYKFFALLAGTIVLSSCTNLTYMEQQEITKLKYQGITVDRMPDGWEKPANPAVAGALNLLPGIGNMYLASGNGGDSSHWLYGFLNLLTWPFSIIWGVPEAVIDANTINQREMLLHVHFGNPSLIENRK